MSIAATFDQYSGLPRRDQTSRSLVETENKRARSHVRFLRRGTSAVGTSLDFEYYKRHHPQNSDPVSTEANFQLAELDSDALKVAADALEASLLTDNGSKVDAFEKQAINAIGLSSYRAFAILALTQDHPSDVRGVAAKLFAESVIDEEKEGMLLSALATCDQPLVRLGLIYGLEESGKIGRRFLHQLASDSHKRVRMEAKRANNRA